MPLVSKTFDQLLDFTRTSSATFVGSNGLVQTTAASRNLLTWTQQFDNAAWFKYTSTITANSTVAPDGTSTADTVLASAGTSVDVGVADDALSYVNGQTYTWSVFAKAGTYNFLQLAVLNISNSWANFDLSTGTVGTVGGGTSSIQNVGDGWYRCSMTFTTTATGSNGAVYALQAASASAAKFAKWSPTGTETVFIWGAQLEAASTATTYTRNNGGVFPPRFDYDPVTLAPKGLLIEEQRTNLAPYSEQFDNAAWTKTAATITANATSAPDGTTTAGLMVPSTTLSQHRIDRATTIPATAHTWSCFVKAGGYGFAWLRIGLVGAVFDLSTGATSNVSAGATTTAQAFANGWWRLSVSATAVGNDIIRINALPTAVAVDFTGDGTSGLFIWGAQIEAGAFATSYIPTVASQVTRTADSCAIVAPNFAPWYNQSEGTFVSEFSFFASNDTVNPKAYFAVSDGTSSNRIYGNLNASNVPFVFVSAGGVTQANMSTGTALTNNAVAKVATAYKTNDFAAVLNAGTVATDTSATVPTVNMLSIANNFSFNQLNGHIRSIRYYPTRLTNAQLQALTA